MARSGSQRLPSQSTKLPEDRKRLTNYLDITYPNLASIRSRKLLHEGRGEEDDDIWATRDDELDGLEPLLAAKEISILAKEKGQTDIRFEVRNEKKTHIYIVESKRAWTSTKVELCRTDGSPILVMFCSNRGFACCARTVVTVTHRRKEAVGHVIYSEHHGELYNAKGNIVLKVVDRTGPDNKIEHAIVEIDSTRVGLIQETSITFGDCHDTVEKALLVGAWVPVGLKIEISKGILSCFRRRKKHVDVIKDVKADYYTGDEADEAEDAGQRRRRRRAQ